MNLSTFLTKIQKEYPDNEIVMIQFVPPTFRGGDEKQREKVQFKIDGTEIYWSAEYKRYNNVIEVYGPTKGISRIINL